jgi:hypothetical protein
MARRSYRQADPPASVIVLLGPDLGHVLGVIGATFC